LTRKIKLTQGESGQRGIRLGRFLQPARIEVQT
jgi:hypothetical protein